MSKVKGSGLECQAVMVQEWLRGATRRPRPGAAPEARGGGQEEQPHVQGAVEEPFHFERQEGRWW